MKIFNCFLILKAAILSIILCVEYFMIVTIGNDLYSFISHGYIKTIVLIIICFLPLVTMIIYNHCIIQKKDNKNKRNIIGYSIVINFIIMILYFSIVIGFNLDNEGVISMFFIVYNIWLLVLSLLLIAYYTLKKRSIKDSNQKKMSDDSLTDK